MDKDVITLIDGEKIAVKDFNMWQLRDIGYGQEKKVAKRILELPRFSEERKQLLNVVYAVTNEVPLCLDNGICSLGADVESIRILKDILEQRTKKMYGEQVVYEAGIGIGYAIRMVKSGFQEVKYYGCDTYVAENVWRLKDEYSDLYISEKTVYEDLMEMDDNSIDVFYADNVVEHFIPDEAGAIFDLLNGKMKKGGIVFLVIPNKLTGPHDVSRFYLPKGTKAEGLHFMEMSYGETIRLLLKSGFKPKYIYINRTIKKDILYMRNIKRILTEWLISTSKNVEMRMELMRYDDYVYYILQK